VVAERFAPRQQQWDRDRTHLPHEDRRFLGDLGLLALSLPEEYGAAGGR
jgi:alkylation response protein AidB-like acyl-CoA dehydrogenase